MPVAAAPFKQPAHTATAGSKIAPNIQGGHPDYCAGELLRLREALGLDVLAHPELLEMPQYAVMPEEWFWYRTELNALVDKGDFLTITSASMAALMAWQIGKCFKSVPLRFWPHLAMGRSALSGKSHCSR